MHGDYRSKYAEYEPHRDELVNYSISMIHNVIENVGSREPGSADERAAQNLLGEDLKSYCDDVHLEDFTVHPHALLGWVILDAYFLTAATFMYIMEQRLFAYVLTAISVMNFVFEFVLYWEFIDFLFPKRNSSNLVAVIKPQGEVKRRAIFNAHTDSNYEWWYNYLGGGHLLAFMVVMGVFGAIISLILQTIFYSGYNQYISYLNIVLLPFYAGLLFFTNWNEIVPGVNDNLTGCVTCMSVAKYLAENGIKLQNTEVRLVLTGSEEPGLRGSKAYAKAHPVDDIETAFFAFDTLKDLDDMGVYNRDLTGTVQNDERVCSIMKRAGELAGLDLPYRTLFFGASDAAALSQAGIPAALFAAMDPTPANYYHTRRDTEEILEPKAIGYGIDIAIGSLFIFDEEGLNGQT